MSVHGEFARSLENLASALEAIGREAESQLLRDLPRGESLPRDAEAVLGWLSLGLVGSEPELGPLVDHLESIARIVLGR